MTLYNLGVRRDTSAEIAARWLAEAAIRLPPEEDGRLVFSFGVNDCVWEAGGIRIAETASLAHARSILAAAQTRWPTLMVGPPGTCDAALDGRVQHLSDQLAALCATLHIPFLPLFAPTRASAAWRRECEAGDGIHPNRQGYTLLFEAVRDWRSWREWLP